MLIPNNQTPEPPDDTDNPDPDPDPEIASNDTTRPKQPERTPLNVPHNTPETSISSTPDTESEASNQSNNPANDSIYRTPHVSRQRMPTPPDPPTLRRPRPPFVRFHASTPNNDETNSLKIHLANIQIRQSQQRLEMEQFRHMLASITTPPENRLRPADDIIDETEMHHMDTMSHTAPAAAGLDSLSADNDIVESSMTDKHEVCVNCSRSTRSGRNLGSGKYCVCPINV